MKKIFVIAGVLLTLQLPAQESGINPANSRQGPLIHKCTLSGDIYVIDPIIIPLVPIKIPITYESYPKRDYDNPSSHILTREDIDKMPAMTVNEMVSLFPGVYQSQRGCGIGIFGSRMGSSRYFIDGIQVR